jgi:hypothetical protein
MAQDSRDLHIARPTTATLRPMRHSVRRCGRPGPGAACRFAAPTSNGIAETVVKTFKRDDLRLNPQPDASMVMVALDDRTLAR